LWACERDSQRRRRSIVQLRPTKRNGLDRLLTLACPQTTWIAPRWRAASP
jgi:hypothetical protein